MRAQVEQTPQGAPSLRRGDVWLEDAVDPVAGAAASIRREQVEGADPVVLFGAGLGYRVLWLRELGVTAPIVFEPEPAILDLARRTVPVALQGVPTFCDEASLLSYLRERLKGDERMVLVAPPGYQQAFPQEHRKVEACLRDAQGFAQLRRNTIDERIALITESALKNVSRLSSVPSIEQLDKPLAGCPAFIVAAGPSLDRNAHLLPKAALRGAIFAVNTSAPVVLNHGPDIDVLVNIETISVRQTLTDVASRTRLLALDLSANSASYEVEGPGRIAFISRQGGFADLSDALRLSGLAYGPSVATAAYSLAYRWGADPIVLLGQDLAFSDGQIYATGTGREQWRVDAREDALHFHRDAEVDHLFESHGLRRPVREQARLQVARWGGGTVDTTYDLTWFRRWFESAVKDADPGRRFINATEGGASIDGFEERTLASVVEELEEIEVGLQARVRGARPLSKKRVDTAKRSLQRSARRVVLEADRFFKKKNMDAKQANVALRAAQRSSLVWAHAIGTINRIKGDDSLDATQSAYEMIHVVRRSAKRIVTLLS